VFKTDRIMPSNMNIYSTFIMNIIGRTYVSSEEVNKHVPPIIIIPKSGRSDFQFGICRCFIVDLLMQHKSCCVHVIDGSWERMKHQSKDTHIP
jgi:hypothetical protein